jgi:cytidine deaminase
MREFTDLKAPIIMFDKDDNYIVMRLEEVSSSRLINTHVSFTQKTDQISQLLPVSFGPEALPPPGSLRR